MVAIYTIGYQKKPLSEFISRLRAAGVDAVIDIRLRNTSQLAGYTKRDDLAFLLREGFGIAYEHHPELAPSDAILDAFRENGDWTAYQEAFQALLVARQVDEIGRELVARYGSLCLLCAEPGAEQCHRRLVAEYWRERNAELTIIHL